MLFLPNLINMMMMMKFDIIFNLGSNISSVLFMMCISCDQSSSSNARYPLSLVVSKVGNFSRGWPEGSLFDSALTYTKVKVRVLLLSLDCSTLPLIPTLYCWVLSKEASSTIFWVFGMTRPEIKPRSLGPVSLLVWFESCTEEHAM